MRTSVKLRLLCAVALGAFLPLSQASAAGIAGAPVPFDKGGVHIAVVSYLGSGDWLQGFESGVKTQADALGVKLTMSEARNNDATERDLIDQAINQKVDGIVINNGKPDALKDIAQKALDAGIKVVAYDVDLGNSKIPQIEQSDADMATLVLDQAIEDEGPGFVGGAVYVAGFAPLEHRYAVWKEFVKKYHLTEKATWGVVNATVPASVADQTKAVLRANPDIKVIFTPWDEFAKGAALGINELGLGSKVKIYGVDTSTADIQIMRQPNSPWMATAATNSGVVGEVAVRALALDIAGQFPGRSVMLKPTLITRAMLEKDNISNMQELEQKFPAFRTSDVATASWMPALK